MGYAESKGTLTMLVHFAQLKILQVGQCLDVHT